MPVRKRRTDGRSAHPTVRRRPQAFNGHLCPLSRFDRLRTTEPIVESSSSWTRRRVLRSGTCRLVHDKRLTLIFDVFLNHWFRPVTAGKDGLLYRSQR